MAKITLAWELGEDLGHVVRYACIARELIQRGHTPTMVLRDNSRTDEVLGDLPVSYIQAPASQGKVPGLLPAINYAETLAHCGFLKAQSLHSLVNTWRNTFQLIQPDVLVLDHAPAAQITAHALKIPRLRLGASFAVAPDISPMPPYIFWKKRDSDLSRLLNSEVERLEVVNEVLKELGLLPVSSLAEIFHTDATYISTYPDFDVYGPRGSATYVGALVDHELGAMPKWPLGNGPKIFAYLKPKFKYLDFVLTVLGRLDASVIAYIPGLSITASKKYESASLSFSQEPLSLLRVAQNADYAVCHAGAGTISVFAEAGVPQFLIPTQMEQMMNAARVAEAGIALFFPQNSEPQLLQKLFKQFFSDQKLKENAKQWAATHPTPSLQARVSLVCDGIEKQLGDSAG